ncbi:MAG: peptidase M20 [Clostridium sp. SCN 57-10]|nr:MAG: peptidase M20 [Clostridium sp. SCN 57-10]
MLNQKIDAYFAEHRDEIVEDVKTLCRIRSVREEAKEGMPYGEGPYEALVAAMKMAGDMGFATRNYDGYVCTADYNDKETELAVLAHLDVVHEGTDWTVTEPFNPIEKEGRLYGRGTSDNKGPAVMALHAMKALREIGVELSRNCRVILGTDEECGSSDLRHYFSVEKAPPASFTPDAYYPVVNVEKGGLSSDFTAEFAEDKALPRVVSLKGGHTENIVAQYAEVVIEGMPLAEVEQYCKKSQEKTRAAFTAREKDGRVIVSVKGLSAHASTPMEGINAVLAAVDMVCGMPMAKSEGFACLCGVNQVFPFGDGYGVAAGVAQSDEISGKLTINIGIFDYSLTRLYGNIDSRCPVCANEENMSLVLDGKLRQHGIQLAKTKMRAPHYTPEDTKLVKTLLSVYEEVSGEKGECMSMGGGTYVHNIEGGVAFGCCVRGVEYNEHGPNESAVIDHLLMGGRMFARAIAEICK